VTTSNLTNEETVHSPFEKGLVKKLQDRRRLCSSCVIYIIPTEQDTNQDSEETVQHNKK
jgi:hypothetical protein